MLPPNLIAKYNHHLDLAIQNEMRRARLLELEEALVAQSAAHVAATQQAHEELQAARTAERKTEPRRKIDLESVTHDGYDC